MDVGLLIIAGVAIVAAIATRRGSPQRARIVRWLAIVVTDIALWYVSLNPPIGPVPIMVIVLLLVNLVLVMDLVHTFTGFGLRTRRSLGPGAGQYKSVRRRGGYSGYRGD